MLNRLLAFVAIAVIAIGVLAGCDSNGEQQRSVVTVSYVNEGVPVLVDVLEQGDSVYQDDGVTPNQNDDFIAPDWLICQFYNRPYNGLVTTGPGEPHGDFLITRYRIDWERIDGGTGSLPTLDFNTSILVPSGFTTEAAILLVNFDNKNLPVLSDLRYVGPNAGDEIFMRANITFFGHEVGTERETEVSLQIGVSFADLVVATSDKN